MKKISIVLCLTHRCNLNCVYCYERHDSSHEMSFDVAKTIIDKVAHQYDTNNTHIEFLLFGGEPLLRFSLIQNVVQYIRVSEQFPHHNVFAPTNGTVLTDEMKAWLVDNKDVFVLGLSLDGTKSTQDINRSNSFDRIDLSFFKATWPSQNVKMTVSRESIRNYANDVIFIHQQGFGINGADFCIATQDWKDDSLLSIFARQMSKLVGFYSTDNNYEKYYNTIFNRDLATCVASNRAREKYCGVGDSLLFYDSDGSAYPCTMLTPMNLTPNQINALKGVDFSNPEYFIDEECFANCLIYPICNKCYAGNYINNGRFDIYSKDECALKEIEALYLAEFEARKIVANPSVYEGQRLYLAIEAIKQIKERYYPKYESIMQFSDNESDES